MSAIDELCRMLDERGVEWETDRSGFRVMWGKPVDEFHDTMQFKAVDNALPNGGLNVHICGFTPEQAIAATLGRGTCHIEQACHERIAGCDNYHDEFACSECGSDMFEHFNFCPNCGRKVVGE